MRKGADQEMADNFVFHRSYYDAARNMDDKNKLWFLNAILVYAFEGVEIDFGDCAVADAAFTLVRPKLNRIRKGGR